MPLPQGLTKFNRVVTNKVMKPLAARMGGFAVLEHTGRRSGKVYQTPMNVFREGDEIVVALTYGSDVDWLKNARSSDRSTFVTQGERVPVGPPAGISQAEGQKRMPAPVRMILNAVGVDEFVQFSVLEMSEQGSE